jgi:hypothetical protein
MKNKTTMNAALCKGQSIEERVLLESRLERANQSWQLVPIDKTIPVCRHSSQWLTVSYPNSAGRLEPREFPHADLLAKHKMVAAGGYVVSWLLYQYCGGYDMDIFVVGCDPNDASARVWAFMRDLIARIARPYRIVHSQHQIKIVFEEGEDWRSRTYPLEYQFILRLYPSIAHIVGGFDISTCGVAHDGLGAYATKLAKWSLKRKCILVDVTRSSPSFAQRVKKYHRDKMLDVVFVGVPADAYTKYQAAYAAAIAEYHEDMLERAREEQRKHEMAIYYAAQHAAQRKLEDLGVNARCYIKVKYKYPDPEPHKDISLLHSINNRFHMRKIHHYDSTHSIVLRLSKMFAVAGRDRLNLIIRHGNSTRASDYSHPMDAPYQPQGNTALLQRGRSDLISVCAYSDAIKDPMDVLQCAPEFADTAHTAAHVKVVNDLQQLQWITDNPGRQWTASFDPRPLAAPTYYLYDDAGKPLYVGLVNQSHIIRVLWLGWKYDRRCRLAILPRDMMNMLTMYTLHALAKY